MAVAQSEALSAARSWISVSALPAALTLLVFGHAALIFSVEPMFSKLALPLLGGAPSVWNTCLVFFQAALLAGYCYAHVSTRRLGLRRQLTLHSILLLISIAWLPLQLRMPGNPPSGSASVLWLIGVLALSLSMPFIMLSATSPLAQRWLAGTGHPRSRNPYFLYAASNLGSFVALLSYPLLIEPRLTLSEQRVWWSAAYVVFGFVLVGCAALVRRFGTDAPAEILENEDVHAVTGRERLRWIVTAAVPSSLLLGVTTFITTDVAAYPLFWVIPLALYLLTFVITFSGRTNRLHKWIVRLEPIALAAIALVVYWGVLLSGVVRPALLHLAVFFVVTLACHGELARTRPPPRHLTEFFVSISVGGLVGGSFNALAAPLLFNAPLEYPLALVAAALLRPRKDESTGYHHADIILPFGIAAALFLVSDKLEPPPNKAGIAVTAIVAVCIVVAAARPIRLALALVAVFVAGLLRPRLGDYPVEVLFRDRSYFGVYRVTQQKGVSSRWLRHGTTLHGAQARPPGDVLEPMTYYHRDGPIGDVFARTVPGKLPDRRVALVGLGIGTLACYGRSQEAWTFYEIDPLVARIAMDTSLFTFLRRCPPRIRIALGDARLRLREATPGTYDILVLDAFTSDAIPIHLLTREAVSEYVGTLRPHGVLAIHISNRHMKLEPVVASIVRDLQLPSLVRWDRAGRDITAETGRTASYWIAVARDENAFGDLRTHAGWKPLRPDTAVQTWTDDYSNLVQVIRWK